MEGTGGRRGGGWRKEEIERGEVQGGGGAGRGGYREVEMDEEVRNGGTR